MRYDLKKHQSINFLLDFSMFDALDACLMVHGSWLKAHGSCQGRPGEAHGLWPEAAPALGTQRRASGPGPALRASGSPGSGRPQAKSHDPWP